MSLFKRPAWAKAQTNDTDDTEEDLFRHSNTFASIAADSARLKKAREEKVRVKKERKERKDDVKREVKEEGGRKEKKPEVKRRRITAEDSAKLLGQIGIHNAIEVGDDSDEDAGLAGVSPVRRSPRRLRTGLKEGVDSLRGKSKISGTADLDESTSDEMEVTASTTRPPPPPPEPEEEEDSDPEFVELKRSAREKQRLKEQREKAASSTPDVGAGAEDSSAAGPGVPAAKEPPIQILIDSPIEGTTPLLVYRKLHQRLQEVRMAWCSRQQGWPNLQPTRIFLTHRGHKLWDVSTCRSLGLELDANGEFHMRGERAREGVEQVYLEAMDEATFQLIRAGKAREAAEVARQARIDSGQEEVKAEVQEDVVAEEEVEEVQRIGLVIKAKDKHDYRVLVRPTMAIRKILKYVREEYQIDAERHIYLESDGERLAPEDRVQDTDLEDGFTLDLHYER